MDATPTPSSPAAARRLRIITFNIGLKGLRNIVPDCFGGSVLNMFEALGQPDILCLQETKITRPELGKFGESFVRIPDIYGFFAFNRKGTGYSGVVTYVKAALMPFAAGAFWV